jgi:hypothetical protein
MYWGEANALQMTFWYGAIKSAEVVCTPTRCLGEDPQIKRPHPLPQIPYAMKTNATSAATTPSHCLGIKRSFRNSQANKTVAAG